MKKLSFIIAAATFAITASVSLSSCSIFGLDWQKDYHRVVDTVDAHVYKNAWDYLKQRSIENKTDTIFKRMYDGIIYSGMDTAEYMKTDRTFIFLHNDAIYRSKATDCYFGAVKDTLGKTLGTTWTTYRKSDVKAYLQYLIVEGQYSHYNLPITNISVQTIGPKSFFPLAPDAKMKMMVLNGSNGNTQDDPIMLNALIYVRTSDIMPTNGVIHVIDKYLTPQQ
ncbi:MAG: fasciclin domain-containing protein [Filimonas sp.]|nr:fasciclin domain-containing protein [Filimonas sp.]